MIGIAWLTIRGYSENSELRLLNSRFRRTNRENCWFGTIAHKVYSTGNSATLQECGSEMVEVEVEQLNEHGTILVWYK